MTNSFSFFGSQKKKSWIVGDKKVDIFYDEKGLHKITLTQDNIIHEISPQNVEIPKEVLQKPQYLEKFFAETYVKIAKLSDEEYKISINQRCKGGGHTIGNPSLLWPGGRVPYEFGPVLRGNRAALEQAQLAIKHWNDETNFFFVQKTSTDRDYLVIGDHSSTCSRHPGEIACHSFVGRQGGRQSVLCDLDAPGFDAGAMVHELGHAVGLYHEHTRPDREHYVTIHWDNIHQENRHNFMKPEDSRTPTAYDLFSIMHYPRKAFPIKSLYDTITPVMPLPQGAVLGQRQRLSSKDIITANRLAAGIPDDISAVSRTTPQNGGCCY